MQHKLENLISSLSEPLQSCRLVNTAEPDVCPIGRHNVRPSQEAADAIPTTIDLSATRRQQSKTTLRKKIRSGTSMDAFEIPKKTIFEMFYIQNDPA